MEKLLDHVLQNYGTLEGSCEGKVGVDETVCVKCHSDSYYSPNQPKYDCGNFRRLCVIRYAISRVKLTSDVIGEHIMSCIEGRARVSAASLGGGAGAEALALMHQLSTHAGKFHMVFNNVDREPAWEPIYRDLVATCSRWFANVQVDARFRQGDVSSPFSPFGKYDIVFVSWILSEPAINRAVVLANAANLAHSGGCVLITDRIETDLARDVSALVGGIKSFDLLCDGRILDCWCGVSVPDGDRAKFGIETKGSIAYWALRKT